MAKTDNRLKCASDEYQSVRKTQDKTFEAKAQELIQAVKRNSDKLDAIMEHLGVRYVRRQDL